MKDRAMLRNLATLIETMPSIGSLRKRVANRLRAIAETIPEKQGEEEMTTVEIAEPELVVTDGLPSGVFVFVSPGPLEGSPPTVTGCFFQGQLYGSSSNPGWFFVPRANSQDVKNLAITLEKEGLSAAKLIKE
jgi:hypothetical protein